MLMGKCDNRERIKDFCLLYQREHSEPPTSRTVADALNIRSSSLACYHMKKLGIIPTKPRKTMTMQEKFAYDIGKMKKMCNYHDWNRIMELVEKI